MHGGVVCLRAGAPARSIVHPLHLPDEVELIVFSTGTPSSTVDHVRALEANVARQPEPCRTRLAALGDAAAHFIAACVDDDARRPSTPRGSEQRARRARAEIGLPIVTPSLAAAATLAEELGGAAKPSGAGGGDVGVAFLTDRGAAETFRERAPHLGVEILSIRTDASGLRRESSARERNHVER